jgi:hypothetical protein
MTALAKVSSFRNVGAAPVSIQKMRRASIQAHQRYGMPVIHKHKWNWLDVREGRAQVCPFHDPNVEGDRFDYYCFGTGFLGGWADGIVTYITIADVQEDVFRISEQGTLIHEANPGFTAPWTPPMGDGDLLITGDFDEGWNLVYDRERYTLDEVTPVTIRGFQSVVQTKEFVVHQSGNLNKLPFNDYHFQIPIVFDYGNLPTYPVVPPGGDPDDYPTGRIAQSVRASRIAGRGGLKATDTRLSKTRGLGTTSTDTRGTSIVGKGEVIIHF